MRALHGVGRRRARARGGREEADLRDADASAAWSIGGRPDARLPSRGGRRPPSDAAARTALLADTVLGTQNLLEALRPLESVRLVHVGSSLEYGRRERADARDRSARADDLPRRRQGGGDDARPPVRACPGNRRSAVLRLRAGGAPAPLRPHRRHRGPARRADPPHRPGSRATSSTWTTSPTRAARRGRARGDRGDRERRQGTQTTNEELVARLGGSSAGSSTFAPASTRRGPGTRTAGSPTPRRPSGCWAGRPVRRWTPGSRACSRACSRRPVEERRHERPEVSVVVPLYRTADALPELHRRIVAAALEGRAHLRARPRGRRVPGRVGPRRRRARRGRRARSARSRCRRNVGQHAAGAGRTRRANGAWAVVLDGDLQDPPEAIPLLLDAGAAGVPVVFAGAARPLRVAHATPHLPRIYKRTLALVAGVPADAGIFMALDRWVVERLVALGGGRRRPSLVAMVGWPARADDLHPRRACTPAVRPVELRRARPAAARRPGDRLGGGASPGGCEAGAGDEARERRPQRDAAPLLRAAPKTRDASRPGRPTCAATWTSSSASPGSSPGQRVLEVGCGMGRYTLLLAERGIRVEGIDLSAPAARPAARVTRSDRFDIPLHAGDVLAPPEPLGTFDAVVGFFALHHIHDLPATYRAMAGLVAPGGPDRIPRAERVEPALLRPDRAQAGHDLGGRRRGAADAALAGSSPRWRRPGSETCGSSASASSRRSPRTPLGPAGERALERGRVVQPVLPFQLFGGVRPSA